jgi:hypothetical protein
MKDEMRRYHLAWYNDVLAADMWFGLAGVTPREAAMLMCELDPHDDTCNPLTITNLETGPDEYKRLLRVFQDVEQENSMAPSLRQWIAIARDKALKYHSWIDRYVAGMPSKDSADSSDLGNSVAGEGGGTVEDDAPSGKARDEVPSPVCSDFRSMQGLMASELKIEFTAGELGAVILTITARGLSRRIGLLELGLVDRRNGNTNEQGLLLLGMAQKRTLASTETNISKRIERLRDTLRLHLGIKDNPISTFKKGCGYQARFDVVDNRGAADARAKRDAERRNLSLDELQGAGVQFGTNTDRDYPFDNEGDMAGDEADRFLKSNAR